MVWEGYFGLGIIEILRSLEMLTEKSGKVKEGWITGYKTRAKSGRLGRMCRRVDEEESLS